MKLYNWLKNQYSMIICHVHLKNAVQFLGTVDRSEVTCET